MPSKKKKYNARFPAGRIKKIMQTDEEVGKVAQAVPVMISRTLELFVKSLLVQATQITTARNAKTLSPSHLKQCILHETRFDFLRELVKNIPDVTAAEEKEMLSAENSPNSTSEAAPAPARRAREEPAAAAPAKRRPSEPPALAPPPPAKLLRTETVTSAAIDLTRKPDRPNFYQETLPDVDEAPQSSVIRVNPSYASPQPSTSGGGRAREPPPRVDGAHRPRAVLAAPAAARPPPAAPLAPFINIDFTKSMANPEIQVLDTRNVSAFPRPRKEQVRMAPQVIPQNYTVKALSRSASQEQRRKDSRPIASTAARELDRIASVTAEIDEDYDT